ncbi:cathepsin L [Caerostris extrusa]|uniref:Cathepsin L n=1 Tax=Caerostris extrusa TaxID=172846 RepID=A0AAV4NDU4_CAEEX|nr:cathepsin L [Caerostris extrusa]
MNLIVFFTLIGIVSCFPSLFDADLDPHWKEFKQTFGKSYSKDEEFKRRIIWENKIKWIVKHNLQADLGFHSYHMGINKYSDLTYEEFTRSMMGYRPGNLSESIASHWLPLSNIQLPDTVDWRAQDYVTPIKDQESCGSCWAFSATGSLEGQHKKKTGYLASLSEQNLVDCVTGNAGCAGGWMDTAFQYIKNNNGIDTEVSYPYKGIDDTCHFNPATVGATCTGYVDVGPDESSLQQAVATIGPISVTIEANDRFINYKGGIFDDPTCGGSLLNHAVLIVGYGTEGGQDYWLVKNSWGVSWGLGGYVKMSRNKSNQCGIASKASYPLV